MRRAGRVGAVLLLFSASACEQPAEAGHELGFEWNARAAEHLLNRAGFGAAPEEIARAVELGPEAVVEQLLARADARASLRRERAEIGPGVFAPAVLANGPHLDGLPPALAIEESFYPDRGFLGQTVHVREYCSEWVGSMLRGDDPLRDRMALFWHGHFVSSIDDVKDSRGMVAQVDFLRSHALDSFEELVRGIARDPAMLVYLNNDQNVRTAPNENWARELMELFTLGEGHYSEDDIKEVARAFAGWTKGRDGFEVSYADQDLAPKTVLGVTGALDGDRVIDILLAEEACARFLAGDLISWFEGVEPSPERVEEYAALLRANGYRIDLFLRELFLDPDFYRAEVQCVRVASPIEFLVGAARRLGVEPPPDLVTVAAGSLGQRLFAPPNVSGWEEGVAWTSTSRVIQRSNLVRMLLSDVEPEIDPEKAAEEAIEALGREFTGPYRDHLALLSWWNHTAWRPDPSSYSLVCSGAPSSDAELVSAVLDRLLATPAGDGAVDELVALVADWKREAGVDADTPLLEAPGAKDLFHRLEHVVLSLPEAHFL